MPIDASIPLQLQQSSPTTTFSQMVNAANGLQNLKKNQATFDADVSSAGSAASSASARAQVDQANVQPLIDQQQAMTQNAQTSAQSNLFKLHKDYADTALQTASGLLNDGRITAGTAQNPKTAYSDADAAKAIEEARQQMITKGVPPEQALAAVSPFVGQIHQPGAVANMLKNTITGQLSAQGQVAAATPNPIQTSTGQQVQTNNMNPFSAGGVGSQPIAPVQQQLPPQTQRFNPETNQMEYIGAQHGSPSMVPSLGTIPPEVQNQRDVEGIQEMQQELAGEKDPALRAAIQRQIDATKQGIIQRTQQSQQSPKVQSAGIAASAPLGAAQNISNNVDEMNRHFASLQDSASSNQLVQELAGNIKNLAQKSIIGTESDKLAYANGLLAALPGHGHADDLKTATDLLNKNMSQLNLTTPATTDAFRAMVSAAQPHSSMSADSISQSADQLASQVQANTAIRNHLSGYKYSNGGQGDPNSYQKERQNIENVADPRAWQYMNLGPGSPAAKQFIGNLSPQDRQKLGGKIQQLEQMGALK